MMKRILNRKACSLLFGIFSLCLMTGFYSCDNKDENITIVDLRYNPEDSYLLTSSSPEKITFQVKSDHPWIVFGNKNADWYTITPSSGGTDSIYLITIVVKENIMLDDRMDTITIKSDYWIGKQFTITQKGIAWLNASHGGDTTMLSGVDRKTFAVTSNQDWSCEVTEGSEWLSVVAGEKGSINGNVTVESKANKGELRKGVVTVFDRHHVPAATVVYQQNGVLLIPKVTEFREKSGAHDIRLEVESNTTWMIEKSEYDVWYTVTTGTSYNGTSTVVIHLDENSGISLRKSEITLKTQSDDASIAPVVKSVILKQAPKPNIEHVEMNSGFLGATVANGSPVFENGDMICDGGQNRVNIWFDRLGTHSFRIKEMVAGSSPCWYMIDGWGSKEFRYHINTTEGRTDISWLDNLEGVYQGANVPLDITKPHVLSITTSDVNGQMRYDLALDDQNIASFTATNLPSSTRLLLYFGSNGGGRCVWDWYEYTPLVDWGN